MLGKQLHKAGRRDTLSPVILAPFVFGLLPLESSQAVYTKALDGMGASAAGKLHHQLHGSGMELATGIKATKVSYFSPRTNSPEGQPQRLSGALFLPSRGRAKGLVVYCHGTQAVRTSAPSSSPKDAFGIAVTFISRGFAVAMPDYLGLGDSTEVHPFPLGRINAASAIDLIGPSRKVASDLGMPIGPKLFVSGFSEGGAVAMWTTRLIEEDPSLGLTIGGSAPIAGPYDLTGVTARSMAADQSNPLWRVGRSYLSGYIGWSAERWAGVKTEDLFSPSMASYVRHVFSTSTSDWQVMEKLAKKALQLRPLALSIRPLLQPAFADALKNQDTSHPLIKLLEQNNCYDWLPQSPMRLIALERDFVVDVENSRKTLRIMRAKGADPKNLDLLILTDGNDHIKAELPAAYEAAEFFDDLAAQKTSP